MIRIRSKARSENKTRMVVEVGGFEIIVDEPERIGGTGKGPTPIEFMLAALSGCINVVGHIVAKEMGFELRGLKVDIAGDLDIDKLLGKSTACRAGYSEIRVTVKPDADADQETLDKWLEAVESRCPVSDNLTNATPVKVSLK